MWRHERHLGSHVIFARRSIERSSRDTFAPKARDRCRASAASVTSPVEDDAEPEGNTRRLLKRLQTWRGDPVECGPVRVQLQLSARASLTKNKRYWWANISPMLIAKANKREVTASIEANELRHTCAGFTWAFKHFMPFWFTCCECYVLNECYVMHLNPIVVAYLNVLRHDKVEQYIFILGRLIFQYSLEIVDLKCSYFFII